MSNTLQRPDYAIIADWIRPDSHVLDLGCGNGTLLSWLKKNKGVRGYGIEINDDYITESLKNDINVIHMDLNEGLSEFDDNSFDYVVLSLTLQAMDRPDHIISEMMRVATEGIVTFPNFGHLRARLQLALGHMPKTRTLPHEWYDTPNTHLCTLKDFEDLCRKLNLEVLDRRAVDQEHKTSLGLRLLPNLLGKIALYRFQKRR